MLSRRAPLVPRMHASPAAALTPLHQRELFALLRAYYQNNGLYDELYEYLVGSGMEEESLRPLRNPANRVVEFYAAKLWPGSLEEAFTIHAAKEEVAEAIRRVWQWSNWSGNKQAAARNVALYGTMVLKVTEPERGARVFIQNIDPRWVDSFDLDERDYVQRIRIDVPKVRRRRDGEGEDYTHTEVWEKGTHRLRLWEHSQPPGTPEARLGRPTRDVDIRQAFGIDFVPFVLAKFRDTGDDWGAGAFLHCVDKIDEANRLATRLHQTLFRHNTSVWALRANQADRDGRPLPAPILSEDTVDFGGEKMLRLPGQSELVPLVPDIDYTAALAILRAMGDELREDLPELAFYALREKSQLSGEALQLLLSDAVDKVREARGNVVPALERANEMALTIGSLRGLFDVGTYEAGDFEHTLELPPILPQPEMRVLEELEKKAALGVPREQLWVEMGYTEEQAAGWSARARRGESDGSVLGPTGA